MEIVNDQIMADELQADLYDLRINEDDLQFNEDNLQINKDDECSHTEENVNEEVGFDQDRDTRIAQTANMCPPSQFSTLIKDLKINLAPIIMSNPIK